MKFAIEHVNITVRDVDVALKFFMTAFPDFKVRARGTLPGYAWNPEWVHVGTDDIYITLSNVKPDYNAKNPFRAYKGEVGVNHVAFVIDDVAGLRARMLAAGYREANQRQYAHSRRFYVEDHDGFEWEFVEYTSNDPAERNLYIPLAENQ